MLMVPSNNLKLVVVIKNLILTGEVEIVSYKTNYLFIYVNRMRASHKYSFQIHLIDKNEFGSLQSRFTTSTNWN